MLKSNGSTKLTVELDKSNNNQRKTILCLKIMIIIMLICHILYIILRY